MRTLCLIALVAWAMSVRADAPKAAAIVNGREIPEATVQRALKPIAKENRDKARADVLAFLVENALIDHYLELLKVTVEPKEVDASLASFKKEVTDAKQEYAKVLEKMEVTEADLKKEIFNQLRWEKFVAQQVTDEKLKKLFDGSPEIFDGTTVRARHILITPTAQTDEARAAAQNKVDEIKKGLDKAIATAVANIPAETAPLDKQKQINAATTAAFASTATKYSSCKSKQDGGDLGEFPRMGMMVEPFAKAAFALKPFEVSEPVNTQFGYHLILVTAKNPGTKPEFEKVKGAVGDVYAAKLREAIVDKMKADANTKIEIVK